MKAFLLIRQLWQACLFAWKYIFRQRGLFTHHHNHLQPLVLKSNYHKHCILYTWYLFNTLDDFISFSVSRLQLNQIFVRHLCSSGEHLAGLQKFISLAVLLLLWITRCWSNIHGFWSTFFECRVQFKRQTSNRCMHIFWDFAVKVANSWAVYSNGCFKFTILSFINSRWNDLRN